jgi:hypothetical protein
MEKLNEELVKKDIETICKETYASFEERLLTKRIEIIQGMQGTTKGWQTFDYTWVKKKQAFLSQNKANRLLEMFCYMYGYGYSLKSINQNGIKAYGLVYFKTNNEFNLNMSGYACPTGRLTLSLYKYDNRYTISKLNEITYYRVLQILYRGKRPLIKHNVIHALFSYGGFSMEGRQ